jgi:hypothetical protein
MIELMNAALISQGFETIVSENDGSDEYRLLSQNWPLIVEAELEDGHYHFTKRQHVMNERVAGKYGYADGYRVPDEALHVRRLWSEDSDGVRDIGLDWVQDGQNVYVNYADGISIEYIEAADASLWSANFSAGVKARLEAVLCRFREEPREGEAMDSRAENLFQRARTNSSKARSPTEPFRRSRFAKARFTRG